MIVLFFLWLILSLVVLYIVLLFSTLKIEIKDLEFTLPKKYRKLNNDYEINISVKNEIKDEVLELISARSYNLLCETLGVILDNSLEATSKSEEKIIYLEFMEKEDKLIINVTNTFKNNIDLEFLGTINYSSKNKSRGLGLYSIIGRKNVSVKTTIRNNLFCHELTINKKKKLL